ncbi:MAG: hypothetical protein R3C52_07655 [Hyphomonadaceae bacterium]
MEGEPFVAGTVFGGRYEIEDLAAGGPRSNLYRARDIQTGAAVMLRLFGDDPRLGGRPESVVDRARAMQGIRHPALAVIRDTGTVNGHAYIVSDAQDDITLREWNRSRLVSGEPLGMLVISMIITVIIDALELIHNYHQVADVTPNKVRVPRNGVTQPRDIRLVDLGIPDLVENGTGGGTGYGANPYSAPEALTFGADALPPSADIYSVGMILYELIAGVPLSGHWRPPSEGRTDVSPELDALVQDCLSNAPRLRPQTAEEFRNRFSAALNLSTPNHEPGGDKKKDKRDDKKDVPPPDKEVVQVKTWKIPDFLAPILKAVNMPFAPLMMIVQIVVGWIEILLMGANAMPYAKRKAPHPALTVIVTCLLVALIGGGVWAGVRYLPGLIGEQRLAGGETDAPQDDPEDVDLEDDPEPLRIPIEEPTPQPAPTPQPTPEPVRPQPTPPPQPASRYESFDGYWTDDFGNTWDVYVDNSGQVEAEIVNGPYTGLPMTGTIRGTAYQFRVGNAYGPGATGQFDGGCHIYYQTPDPAGSGLLITAKFHINHQPGAPCP